MLLVFANMAAAERKVMTWTVDGTKRQAIVYSPSKTSGKAALVFSFHGHGDTALNFEGVGLQDAWPEAVIVYPQGLASSRDGEPGWQNEPGLDGDRDLKLVDHAIAELHKTFPIDDSRIYATGFRTRQVQLFAVGGEAQSFRGLWTGGGDACAVADAQRAETGGARRGPAGPDNAFALQVQSIELAKRVNGVAGKGESCGMNACSTPARARR
jgi:hypothetical protein